jgi:hypothetical protein
LLLFDDFGEVRGAPHAVLQGAPAREAMPQKTTARQAREAKTTLEISGIALNMRRKIFFTARAQNPPQRTGGAESRAEICGKDSQRDDFQR